MNKLETEVLIIGGGVLGCATARELSKYKVDVTLVEKEVDVSWGSSKANIGLVRQGGDCLEFRKEYHRSKLLWDSIPMMESLCKELEVPLRPVGAVAILYDDEQRSRFSKMKSRAEAVGITNEEFWDRERLRHEEPNITPRAIGALYDPTTAVMDPMKFTTALAENAKQNGVNLMLGTEVSDIVRGEEDFEVKTNNGPIKARFIVNAAGLFVDKIAAMVKANNFVIYPVKGYIGVLDKKCSSLINHEIFSLPPMPGEMCIVMPTPDGEVLFGIQLMQCRRNDFSATREQAEAALRNAQTLIPAISGDDIITSFCGFMAMRNWELGWHECVVEASDRVPGFINLSMGYPGISAAPATAKEVVQLLAKEELKLVENPNFNPHRKAIPDFSEASDEEKRQLIAQDSRYSHVVCRCETVTEGEIVEAIKRGATTIDGIKFRTRAGMGRCQAGFCGMRVPGILARELGIPVEQVTKKGGESQQLLYKSKELIG